MSYIKITVYLLLIVNTQVFGIPNMDEGKYNVGFRSFEEYDSTRLYYLKQDTIYRPMLINFWYPSNEKSDAKMNFKQYIDLISRREDFSKPQDLVDKDSYNFVNAYAQFARNTYKIGLDVSTQEILDSQVKSYQNLPFGNSEFPLIIYAPSNSKTPIQNHVICEYLASHGFYVISVSSAGPNSIQRKDISKSILAQVEDMEFILNYAEKNIKINYSNVGLFGFSTGGLATSIFQMKHGKTKAVFGMDGSHEYSLYIALSKLNDYEIDKTEIPYFLVGNQDGNSIYPYFNSIKSKSKLFYRMPYIGHFGFVSFWTYFDKCNPDTIKHNYTLSYEFICESACLFFDATLNGSYNSKEKLKSLGVQKRNYAIEEKLDYSEPNNLLNLFLQTNIDSAITMYNNHKLTNFNNYNYHEKEISDLGRMLLDYELDASVKLFLFNQEEYPESWHTYFDLAFSYKLKGEIGLAKKTLLKAQEKDPDNKDINELMKDLEKEK